MIFKKFVLFHSWLVILGLLWFARFETCYQIALAIKKEVEDLEAAGIQVCFQIQ